jgi:Lar family restriction alleviation protein
MSEKLKPCPFCGGENLYFDHSLVEPDNLNGGQWACSNCNTVGPDTDYWHGIEHEARADAAKKWNTRHVPEGCALVPVEPDISTAWKMMVAGADVMGLKEDENPIFDKKQKAHQVVAAMIAAAYEEAK